MLLRALLSVPFALALVGTATAAPTSCAGAKFLDSDGTCKPCVGRAVKTCSSASRATSCTSRYYLTGDGRCVPNAGCPEATFADKTTGTCAHCFLPTYKSCSSGKSTAATSCRFNTCLPATGGRCIPFTMVKNTSFCNSTGLVAPCPGEGVKTCRIEGTTLTCVSGYFFMDGKCLRVCPEGYGGVEGKCVEESAIISTATTTTTVAPTTTPPALSTTSAAAESSPTSASTTTSSSSSSQTTMTPVAESTTTTSSATTSSSSSEPTSSPADVPTPPPAPSPDATSSTTSSSEPTTSSASSSSSSTETTTPAPSSSSTTSTPAETTTSSAPVETPSPVPVSNYKGCFAPGEFVPPIGPLPGQIPPAQAAAFFQNSFTDFTKPSTLPAWTAEACVERCNALQSATPVTACVLINGATCRAIKLPSATVENAKPSDEGYCTVKCPNGSLGCGGTAYWSVYTVGANGSTAGPLEKREQGCATMASVYAAKYAFDTPKTGYIAPGIWTAQTCREACARESVSAGCALSAGRICYNLVPFPGEAVSFDNIVWLDDRECAAPCSGDTTSTSGCGGNNPLIAVMSVYPPLSQSILP